MSERYSCLGLSQTSLRISSSQLGQIHSWGHRPIIRYRVSVRISPHLLTTVSLSSTHTVATPALVAMLHPEWRRHMSHQNSRETLQTVAHAVCGVAQCAYSCKKNTLASRRGRRSILASKEPKVVSDGCRFIFYSIFIFDILSAGPLFLHRILSAILTSLCRSEVLWLQTSTNSFLFPSRFISHLATLSVSIPSYLHVSYCVAKSFVMVLFIGP